MKPQKEMLMRLNNWYLVIIILAGCSQPAVNQSQVPNKAVSPKKADSTYTYNDNGKPKSLTIYKPYVKERLVMEFDSAGVIVKEEKFLSDGVNSIVKMFYPSGKLWWEVPYTNGHINGVEKKYYENGVLEHEVLYIDATPTGVDKWYAENGKIKTEMFYTKGKITNRKDY